MNFKKEETQVLILEEDGSEDPSKPRITKRQHSVGSGPGLTMVPVPVPWVCLLGEESQRVIGITRRFSKGKLAFRSVWVSRLPFASDAD